MNYLEVLDTYKEDMLKTLKESIAAKSVKADAVRTVNGDFYPFGRGVQQALEHMLEVGSQMGFDVLNVDNYGGHIEFRAEAEDGEKPETFGIIGHLDVVPEGEGWTKDPFGMWIDGDRVIGRGVLDDKGPVVASLYAMKALKESGFKPKKNIRLLLGCDEETGMTGMVKYLEAVAAPDLSFTPDASFPLINGEMGILIFDLSMKLGKVSNKNDLRLTKLEAGTAANAVPGTAKAVLQAADTAIYDSIRGRLEQYVQESGFVLKAKRQGSSLVIEAKGKAAHGAEPFKGLNAASIILDFLGRLQFACDELNEFIDFYNEYIGFNLHGENMGCCFSDEPSGKLIWNVGVASFNEEMASVTVNIRYPVSCTDEAVYAEIEKVLADKKIGVVKDHVQYPIYKSLDDPMVEKLMDAYISETGDTENKPKTIGGGTYAKSVPNTLAFGALFPGEADTMHQADETMSKESFFKMARIYATAIYNICR